MAGMGRIGRSRDTARAVLALALLGAGTGAAAQEAVTLDEVRVLGARRALADFPGAVSVVDGRALRAGQRQVSLAEALVRVPGIGILDRGNFAQDLQLQSRGFGARASFGIRGLRLVVDGIPASALDGQGQAANFPLGMLDRIEVLRGPLALQYGNAAGGAIVAETALDGPEGVRGEAWWDSHASRRVALGARGASADGRWRGHAYGSHFVTDGARPHSAAERSQFDAVLQWSPQAGRRLRLVAGALQQPDTDDPLGLDRAQWQRTPHGTDPAALAFDTRKRIAHAQLGLRWEDDYAPGRAWWFGGYGVQRAVEQFLAVPVNAQLAPTHAGGVIAFTRRTFGFELGHRWQGARGAFALGLEGGRLSEDRQGYENFTGSGAARRLGVRGRLRRDEDNTIRSHDLWASGERRFGDGWSALAAVRHARLRFRSDDRYLAPGNGDDSGAVRYRETAAALGVARAFPSGEVFASIGRGFETPTATELAYRPEGGAGFHRELRPARFVSAELGARWRHADGGGSAALYAIEGTDEIVPADNRGGRASFANAGRTRREGVELALDGRLGARWSYALAAHWLRARFATPFAYRVSAGGVEQVRTVAAGNRMPGIARAGGYAELEWSRADGRVSAALEARLSGRIAADDRNTGFAPGYAAFALRLQWRGRGGWHGFARVDNLADRVYAGSVIVNEGNARWYEPAAGRTFTLGLGWDGGR